ncbi:putative cytochrome P450 monooxygenase [Boeremia exigua]|uniref:putative cytochrome P450 monooxygenase n=1 Tax=Boeremia exigua TaxID=749465 RepID=UPI001E8D802F|nr:putative cytochrome P450 monooxygenase [Boeremia exigua]KAH6637940.1 putative cytochrome P450 monooxygenase [Boeremia exigua]
MSLLAQLYALRWLILPAVFALYFAERYRKYNRLRHFSGPFGTGWSEFWHSRVILGLQSHLAYKDVNDRHGPIARVGPNELITSSPELLAHMNAVRSQYTRSYWFNAATRVVPGKDHLFSELDEGKHTKRRQQMAAGYSGKENSSLEPDIDGQLQELLHLIRSKYISTPAVSKPMDLARKVQYFTLDVISTIGFGEAFGDLKADADLNEYIESGEQGLFIVAVSTALGLTKYMQWPPIARLLGPSEKDKSGFGRMIGVARKLIDSRLEKSMTGRSDMLASFIHHGVPREDLLTESLLQILAGSDTTATAIRATMLYLIAHPRIYRRLQAEVDAAVRSGSVASGIVQDATLKGLPYLQAVAREGLRIFPPVTDVVPKKVPAGGDRVTVEGKQYYLPGGTDISYNAWGVHHDKAMFGEDADLFRPERWLLEENKANEERLTAMRRTTELIFGYGKYQCLGKPIAWLELTKVLFEFMRHFDWALTQPESPWKSTNYNGIWVQEQMWVLVTEREQVA